MNVRHNYSNILEKSILFYHNNLVAMEDYDLFDNGISILSLQKKKNEILEKKNTTFNTKDFILINYAKS